MPRNDRYFLHEDRTMDSNKSENHGDRAEDSASNTREIKHFRFRADEVAAGEGADRELAERKETGSK